MRRQRGKASTPANEQRALAFHDGHACLGPDIAQAENRASVGDDGDKVAATRVGVGEVCVFGDFQARLGNAGGVGYGEFFGSVDGGAADDFYFAVPVFMRFERNVFCVHACPYGLMRTCPFMRNARSWRAFSVTEL